jgi:hypothetical protein
MENRKTNRTKALRRLSEHRRIAMNAVSTDAPSAIAALNPGGT